MQGMSCMHRTAWQGLRPVHPDVKERGLQIKQPEGDTIEQETRRPYVRNIRLSTAENQALQAAAEQAGLSVGGFIRAACLGAPGVRAARRPTVEHRLIAHVLGRLGRCGSNLNQLTFIGHMTGELPTRSDLRETVTAVQAMRADLMRALGREP